MMNNDIKEILEALQETKKDFEDGIIYSNCHYYLKHYLELNYNEQLALLDYITNLQEYYNDNANKYEELLVKYSDLQKENDKLKELCDKYEEEHNTTFNYWKEQLETNKKPNLLQGEDNE